MRLDLELLNLAAGDQRKPAYLALNPCGRTPTLVDGDFVLWESNAIMQYLANARVGGVPLDGYRNLEAWYARVDSLPAWQESRPRR